MVFVKHIPTHKLRLEDFQKSELIAFDDDINGVRMIVKIIDDTVFILSHEVIDKIEIGFDWGLPKTPLSNSLALFFDNRPFRMD